MKNILMIGTGGTIASGQTAEGLAPELDPLQLLRDTPRVAQLCRVDCLQLYSLDSTNIRPCHWLGLARAIRERYDRYDGFVISHGTDTMAYTAAALSYLIQDCPKPIVLTGAQKPIWYDGTDSKRNLTDAFLYACRGCGGVQIVFNGKVILGTRARKTCSKSFQAFSSVNYPDLAVLQDERLLHHIPAVQEGQQQCADHARPVHRRGNAADNANGPAAVQPCGLNDLVRHRPEALGHDKGPQRDKDHRQRQSIIGVQQLQPVQNDKIRHQRHLQRHDHQNHQQEEQDLLSREAAFGKAVTRQSGNRHLPRRNAQAQPQAFPEPQQILLLGKKNLIVVRQRKPALVGNQAFCEYICKGGHGEHRQDHLRSGGKGSAFIHSCRPPSS